jgi:hypothetical protein
MTPSEYAAIYLNRNVMLDNNQIVMVSINKYLLNNGSRRNKNGLAAKDVIIGGMVAETKSSWAASIYKIDGWPINKVDIACVFMGKGSPSHISDAVWLASRYGLIRIEPNRKNSSAIPARTVTQFCDDCVGLDCNGFVNNYFSFSRDKSIDTYDANYPSSRRQSLEEVQTGDAVIFIEENDATAKNPKAAVPAAGLYKHIAAVDKAVVAGQDRLELTLLQSGGPELGLHTSTEVKQIHNYGKGVYFDSGTRKAYIVAPPAGAGEPRD